MTRFMRVIHVALRKQKEDVDGPDKPGHDELREQAKTANRYSIRPKWRAPETACMRLLICSSLKRFLRCHFTVLVDKE